MTMIDRDREPTGPDDIPGLLLKPPPPAFEQTGEIDGVRTVSKPVPPLRYGEGDLIDPEQRRKQLQDLADLRQQLGKVVRDDVVNHPKHYTRHPSGIECIQVTEHMDFLLGNALKYLWRAPNKADITEQIIDLEKARWYIERKINQLQETP